MNIFTDKINKGTLFEDIPLDRLADAYLEFFKLAGEIRTRLGKKAYLLDHYLAQLLEVTYKAYDDDKHCDSMDSVSSLYAICRAAQHPKRKIPHPFFEEGRSFILSHPLGFQERETKCSIYLALLSNGYMKSSVQAYQQEFADELARNFDKIEFEHQYESICKLIGDEAPMERLNLLFQERFLAISSVAVLYKYLTTQLLETLVHRDEETSLQIFQLLLEFNLLDEKEFAKYMNKTSM